MKYKNNEIKTKEIVGIFNCEDLTVEIDGEIVELSSLDEYDNCDIQIKLWKDFK